MRGSREIIKECTVKIKVTDDELNLGWLQWT